MDNKDLEERAKILLEEANQLFNRLEGNISYVGEKVSSFFGIILGVISFQVTLIIIILNNGGRFSIYSYITLILYLTFIFISAILAIYLLRPKNYKDVEMFKKNRFNRLCSISVNDLLSDFLYYVREAYEHNYNVYNNEIKWLTRLYYCFCVENVLYILLILTV